MKHIMKIRLRSDGTWENVYQDGSSDQGWADLTPNMLAKMHSRKYNEITSDYLELAVEASKYRDAKQVIDYIRGLR